MRQNSRPLVCPNQSGYFFVSFCVPNANSIISTPRIQFILVKSQTRHSSSMPLPKWLFLCIVEFSVGVQIAIFIVTRQGEYIYSILDLFSPRDPLRQVSQKQYVLVDKIQLYSKLVSLFYNIIHFGSTGHY